MLPLEHFEELPKFHLKIGYLQYLHYRPFGKFEALTKLQVSYRR